MLVYAALYAKRRGLGFVNVFVGEMHNTDMEALASSWIDLERENGPAGDEFRKIVSVAMRAATGRMGQIERIGRYAVYLGAIAAPLAVAFSAVIAAVAAWAAYPLA